MKKLYSLLTILCFVQATSCVQNSNSNEMKEIKRDNAIINYQITGDADTTLLFVHGSNIDQTYWNDQVNYFSAQYKVVTLDLPGHGKSGTERKQWSIQGFADDLVLVIKELNLKNVILIGHSLGADINLIAATSSPENIIGFVGLDYFKNAATPIPDYEQQAIDIKQKLKIDFANTNEEYARMALLTKKTPSAITSRVVNGYRNAYQSMAVETTSEIFYMFKIEEKLLPQLKLKLFLINVDYIPTNQEPLKQFAINGYEVLNIEGTCHYPMLENPEELNRLLEATFRRISIE